MRTQVAVVGGGPVGLLLACELAGYGVRTLLLETRTEVSERPKATTLHARTLQCLVRRGHLECLLAKRKRGACGVVRSPFHFAGIPGLYVSAPGTEPEPLLKCRQAELEHAFEARARAAGVRILRGHRVTGVRQAGNGVRFSVEGPAGRVDCSTDYLVGADGARGTVREQAGIGAQTHPATVSAMAGDVRLAPPGALQEGWHRTPFGWIVVKNVPGGETRLRTLDCSGAHGERHREPTLAELRREVAQIAGQDIAMTSPRWLSRFSDFSRLADSYRAGRIFLAGDAAHVHFPIGGQGLSTGLLDAVDLGWKLAFTVLGHAGGGLLDTYDEERRAAAKRVITHTRAQLALMHPDPALDPLRELFAELLPGRGEVMALGTMISAQDTVLPARTEDASPWEGTFLYNTVLETDEGRTDVIGLLRDGRPLLLLFGEAGHRHLISVEDRYELLRVVRAEKVPHIPCEALLVRPDGYVAWASGGGELGSALAAYFGDGTGYRRGRPEGSGRVGRVS